MDEIIKRNIYILNLFLKNIKLNRYQSELYDGGRKFKLRVSNLPTMPIPSSVPDITEEIYLLVGYADDYIFHSSVLFDNEEQFDIKIPFHRKVDKFNDPIDFLKKSIETYISDLKEKTEGNDN